MAGAAARSGQAYGKEVGGLCLVEFFSQLRREFSCNGVRSQFRLLLDRLDLLAEEGARRWRAAAAIKESAAAIKESAAADRSAPRVAMQETREVVQERKVLEQLKALLIAKYQDTPLYLFHLIDIAISLIVP